MSSLHITPCTRCGTNAQIDPAIWQAAGRLFCTKCGAVLERPAGVPLSLAKSMPPTALGTTTIPFHFTGSGAAYFRIWIVNLALTILTVGIYSAWAKVRRKQYFYGSTHLAGTTFDYLGNPFTIFKGRLILALLLFLLSGLGYINPQGANLLANALFLIAFPWLVIKSRRFNLRNSAYRNIRFNFNGRYRDALVLYGFYGLIVAITLGLATPWFLRKQSSFFAENSHFGLTKATFNATTKTYFTALAKMSLAFVGFLLLYFGILFGLHYFNQIQIAPSYSNIEIAVWFNMALLILALLTTSAYGRALLFNITWNATTLGQCRVRSTINPWIMVWIFVSNLVITLFSVGLLAPWAKVRSVRYQVNHLALEVTGNLDNFTSAAIPESNALGEEVSDFFDVDIGL